MTHANLVSIYLSVYIVYIYIKGLLTRLKVSGGGEHPTCINLQTLSDHFTSLVKIKTLLICYFSNAEQGFRLPEFSNLPTALLI